MLKRTGIRERLRKRIMKTYKKNEECGENKRKKIGGVLNKYKSEE